MRSLKSIQILLRDRRLDYVKLGTGLSRRAINGVKHGTSVPRPETLQRLSDYFDKQWEQAEKLR